MVWNEKEEITKPDVTGDINYRHGLLMREVSNLQQRVEYLENDVKILERNQHRSIRPHVQTIQTAGVSGSVAGVLIVLFELLKVMGYLR